MTTTQKHPDDVKSRAIDLWADGKSYAEIAASLRLSSRSAAAGIIKRAYDGGDSRAAPRAGTRGDHARLATAALRLRTKAEKPLRPPKQKLPPTHRKERVARPVAAPVTPAPRCEAVTFAALERHHCRWPLGGPLERAVLFCGARKARGSYCEYHAAQAHGGTFEEPSGDEPETDRIPTTTEI